MTVSGPVVTGVMAYDSLRGQSVLVPDRTSTFGPHADTWKFVLPGWTLAPSGLPPRMGHAMAFDSARGRVVVFGGQSNPAQAGPFFGETWEWDGVNWLLAATTGPTGRWYPGMAYDSGRGVTVLFGGESGIPWASQGDTWEWNGTTWILRATTGPSARDRFVMAYDSSRQRTVLFGGHIAGVALDDTWEWDGSSWTMVTSGGPPARYSYSATYDSARGKVVMFGGFTGSQLLGDTWEWDGSSWTLAATSGPSPRSTTLSYDSMARRTVLHGGTINALSGTLAGDTWTWDGSVWTPMTVSGPVVTGVMAYDSLRGQSVLVPDRTSTFGPHADTWKLEPMASFVSLGAGCPGSNGTPILSSSQRPVIGKLLSIDVTQLPLPQPANLVLLVLGFSDTVSGGAPLPISLSPLGMPGCTLFV
jgi:hypothetical protein